MRASDGDRERAIGKLRRAYTGGAMSTDTFEARVARVVAGQSAGELALLTADCPEPAGLWTRVRAAVTRALASSRPAVLEAPPPAAGGYMIGRSMTCSRVLDDRTVSRMHAQLRWVDGGWVLSDLGSLNGTWVNGWRIDSAPLRHGDRVQLGACKLRFRAR
jgi:hypothetical protein